MPRTFHPDDARHTSVAFDELMEPIIKALVGIKPLEARGNRALQMDFEQQLRALVYFHLEEHTSGRQLVQALNEDDFARHHIAPPEGISRSSFCEAINTRGLDQLMHVYRQLQESGHGPAARGARRSW
jgi:hypothetical protein